MNLSRKIILSHFRAQSSFPIWFVHHPTLLSNTAKFLIIKETDRPLDNSVELQKFNYSFQLAKLLADKCIWLLTDHRLQP